MQTHHLVPHSGHAPSGMTITVGIGWQGEHWLALRWRVEGAGQVRLPPFAGRVRRDNLWQTTCFELFVKPAGQQGYQEWNFSPSQAWAAYMFDGYRMGMQACDVPQPPIADWRGGRSDICLFDVALPTQGLARLPAAIGLSAVIEHRDGQRSFWALKQPDGPPDFHADACFAAQLDAAPVL